MLCRRGNCTVELLSVISVLSELRSTYLFYYSGTYQSWTWSSFSITVQASTSFAVLTRKSRHFLFGSLQEDIPPSSATFGTFGSWDMWRHHKLLFGHYDPNFHLSSGSSHPRIFCQPDVLFKLSPVDKLEHTFPITFAFPPWDPLFHPLLMEP